MSARLKRASRPVHVRSVRPKTRRVMNENARRTEQVQAKCGAWVSRCETIREDASSVAARSTCFACDDAAGFFGAAS